MSEETWTQKAKDDEKKEERVKKASGSKRGCGYELDDWKRRKKQREQECGGGGKGKRGRMGGKRPIRDRRPPESNEIVLASSAETSSPAGARLRPTTARHPFLVLSRLIAYSNK